MAANRHSQAWAEAKKRCRLNVADIKMAKALVMTPKSLIKNIPSPKQQWKAPVKEWIRDLYEKKFGKILTVKLVHSDERQRKSIKQEKQMNLEHSYDDEDLPF
ncbi:hypothetical protein JOD43_002997 [Pullulanibacillus pueri]|uniref:Uncharacterized protein n=1 Tax=Pullulanibacillus pueri TaxID=1437324 RepID=A0A8J2ZWB5_9BACL|nr:hypothetical protein [Pullulanibacillus pueri]MBM7682818.1 hypothetical protein [Pullulanibacillus pueri]GGH83306.1 hypothetical protein GCM10007096_23980 [Pullulanibacillus pueri]